MSAGIKVALVDTTLEDTSKVITAIATDNTAGGAAAADALAKLIGEKGEVMVIAFQAGASTSDQRQQGFESEIKKYPNIKYIGFQISNNDPSKAAAEVGSTLAAHPDLAGIFATNDRSAEGAATGLRVADKVGAVKVVGFDAGDTQIKQLKDGLVQALIAQRPYQIGVDGVDAIANALTGKSVEHSVTTGTVTITKDNLQEPEIQEGLVQAQMRLTLGWLAAPGARTVCGRPVPRRPSSHLPTPQISPAGESRKTIREGGSHVRRPSNRRPWHRQAFWSCPGVARC